MCLLLMFIVGCDRSGAIGGFHQIQPGDIIIEGSSKQAVGNKTDRVTIDGRRLNPATNQLDPVTVVTLHMKSDPSLRILGSDTQGSGSAGGQQFTLRITDKIAEDPDSYVVSKSIVVEIKVDTRTSEIEIAGQKSALVVGAHYSIGIGPDGKIVVEQKADQE